MKNQLLTNANTLTPDTSKTLTITGTS